MKPRRPSFKDRLQWEMLQHELTEAKLHNQKLVESNEVLMDDVRELQEKLAEANANIGILSQESEPLSRRAEDIMGINAESAEFAKRMQHAPKQCADAIHVAAGNGRCICGAWPA